MNHEICRTGDSRGGGDKEDVIKAGNKSNAEEGVVMRR
jgi:hypothetical protein